MTEERIKEIQWSKPMDEYEFARAIKSEVQKEQAEKIAELEAAKSPSYACKFCGAASWVEPSDQTPPPDYCHESDHGEAE